MAAVPWTTRWATCETPPIPGLHGTPVDTRRAIESFPSNLNRTFVCTSRLVRCVLASCQLCLQLCSWPYSREIKEHSAKYGGQALTEEELREVFRDFDTSGDHQIDKEEFLAFFSRSVKALSNAEFETMVGEMTD